MDKGVVELAIISKLNEVFNKPKVYTEKNANITENDYPLFFINIRDIIPGQDSILGNWNAYPFHIKFILSKDSNVIADLNECLNIIGNRLINYFTFVNIGRQPIMLEEKQTKWSTQNGEGLFESTIKIYEFDLKCLK